METTDTYRFSESPLWVWQRKYYETQGIKAWQQQEVPHHITCSSIMASAYAEIVFALLCERAKRAPGNKERIYLVEAGAGSGKLAFRVLKKLRRLYSETALQLPPYTYIVTDLARANIDFWKSHAGLRPFIDAGELDVARFDAMHDTVLTLEYAGLTITPGSLSQPVVVLANYFFDSIPQDLFYISSGTLYEVRVQTTIPAAAASPLQALPPGLQLNCSIQQAAPDYYPEPEFNRLLEKYTATLEETHLFFPHIAIRCLKRLEALSEQGMLLLTADKGEHRVEKLDGFDLPLPDQHGSFSLPVNYHAIVAYFETRGAFALASPFAYTFINTLALLSISGSANGGETTAACRKQLQQQGPDDFHHLQVAFFNHIDTASAPQLFAYLKINGCDADLLIRSIPRLMQLAETLDLREQETLVQICAAARETHYALDHDDDLDFRLGVLLYLAAQFREALPYFEASRLTSGETAPLLFNMASCYFQLDDMSAARKYAGKVLALEPGHAGAEYILREG